MRRAGKSSKAVWIGTAAGAVLTALAAAVVYGLKTGAAGAVLAVLMIAVAAATGWFAGRQCRFRESNRRAYMKGYQAGLEKNAMDDRVSKLQIYKVFGTVF